MNLRWCIFSVLLLIFSFSGRSQQYNFRNYNVEDGLGQSQVYSILQDERGQLWLGTRGSGISVFDGFEFHSYTSKDGLPSNYINEIVADTSGRIWVATNKGLCFFNGRSFTKLDLGVFDSDLVVRDIFVDTQNNIYCATEFGIYNVDENKAIALNPINGKPINASSIYVDEEKAIWIGTNDGFFVQRKGVLTEFSQESEYMKNSITTVNRDESGTFWIGTYGDGMYCYDGERFYRVDYHLELYRQTVLDIHLDEHQNVWIATLSGGVVHYDKATKTFTSITEKEGLSNNHVRCIVQDNSHNFWFGTSGGGVCHYLGKQFTNYDQRSGLAGNYIYSVLRDKSGKLWIGNSQKGVSVLTNEGFINYDATNEFHNVKVKALGEDNAGSIWLGTDAQGLYVYKNERFEAIDELRRAYVKQIKVDKAGQIWIATAGSGIIKVTDRQGNYIIEKWTTEEGLISNRITSIHFDKNGRLWYGTENDGVGCLNKKRKNIFQLTTKEGLSSNLIRALAEDKNGRLWIGTAGEGICSFNIYENIKKPKCISENDGLKSNNIYLIATDKDGNVIVGTEKGLDYIYFGENGSPKQIKHYGKRDGFTGVETCQNAVWNDSDGSIWFGTINGLCQFNPSELVINNQSPTLSLRDIKLFYESILGNSPVLLNGRQDEELKLGYSQNHISFDFLGINLKRPEGVMYRWRLRGFDENWSPPSKDHSILYSNLNPGIYVFEVMASNEDGIWSEHPLQFEFEIETPYWKTTWFAILVVFSFLVILLAIYLFSVNRIRKKAMEKQQQIALEKDFLELEQKAMRLQMNPHFIFNALNSIQSLIGTGKETEARYYLAKFSRLMRQILDNSRQSEITLEEEVDTLENYLLVEQFCNGDRFQYTIDVDPSIEKDFITIPPMLIQPFVENAIKHGMKGRSEQNKDGKIEIRFTEKKGILECIIEDNGIGREQAAKLKEVSKETYHKSTSLAVTTERLNLMGAGDAFEPFEIVDLYTDEVASGTRVIIRIPLE
jgi:ligand-binding sensor domain-containing protein/two-component sensor histidine kinase